jgi:hypothetical protein
MKTKLIRFCPLLLLLAAGCANQGYGPTSIDYYPRTSPPFDYDPGTGQPTSSLDIPALPGLAGMPSQTLFELRRS